MMTTYLLCFDNIFFRVYNVTMHIRNDVDICLNFNKNIFMLMALNLP